MPGSRSVRSTPAAPPAARAAWGSISRDVIVAKAVEMVSRRDASGLSVRALATELGVTPMALYRHVANKDDLLDEVVNLLQAQRWRPEVPTDPWQDWMVEAADLLRRFLVEEPLALRVYSRRPVVSPTAMQRMDTCIAVMRDGLGDDAKAHRAYASMQTYTIGFAALEAARNAAEDSALSVQGDEPGDVAERMREMADYTSPAQFRRGLGYLLRGLTAD